jgi:hypothetical protein
VEKQGEIRPGQISHEKINARLWGERLTDTSPIRLEAVALTSSKVRGVASSNFLGHRANLKPPFRGYAPSEFLTKPWSIQAPIEEWCPYLYGAYIGFNDDGDAIHSRRQCIARQGLKSTASLCPVAYSKRLALRDVAPRSQTWLHTELPKTIKVRWTVPFVLDSTFNRRSYESRTQLSSFTRLLAAG